MEKKENMERIDEILHHKKFRKYLKKTKKFEKDRRFCKHNMEHFLSVARIAQILNLENELHIPKVLIYAAALLHDIGRFVQYEEGTPHEQASAELAPEILEDCGFEKKEIAMIVRAIKNHRNVATAGEKSLTGVIYRADKLSRPCFGCKKEGECDWKKEKKNLKLRY